MKFVVAFIYSVCMCCIAFNVQGQTADTIQLQTINIRDVRTSHFLTGSFITEFDSTILKKTSAKNLGELLSSSSTVFIKSNGSGGSATISSRGTESRHSAILWNGFNINSSTLGLTDLSLVPVSLAEKITLIHGGSGAVSGNSSLGSTINLESADPTFRKHTQIGIVAEGGSFGNEHLNSHIKFGSGFIESKTSFFIDKATNNFKYKNLAVRDQPVEVQKHASTINYGLTQDFHIKIKHNQVLSIAGWYQVNERQIPKLMTVPESKAEQRDSILRIFAGYKINTKKSVIHIKSGFFREYQFYSDPQYQLNLKYLVTNFLIDAEWKVIINDKLTLRNGTGYTYSEAGFEEYDGIRKRTLAKVFSNFFYTPFTRLKISGGVRQEIASSENPPLAPSLGMEYAILWDKISLTGNIGRHYNTPSMNDLYWIPGGNPDLKPENAWSKEAGLVFFKNHLKYPSLKATYFNSVVDNWIKWQPVSGGIYSPDNLRQVKTSGIEASLSYQRQIRSVKIISFINYAYTKSELSEAEDSYSELAIGKQLMYIPLHMANIILQFSYKNFTLNYTHTYTGERFTSTDNKKFLDYYQLADLSFEYTTHFKNQSFSAFGRIANIYDSHYQVLIYQPTPGRWYSAGVKINFNFNNKKIKS